MVRVQLPMSHRAARMTDRKEREALWESFGRGTLPLDALVCLTSSKAMLPAAAGTAGTAGGSAGNGGGVGSGGDKAQPMVVFATIGRRDPKEMADEHPVIGLAFDRGQGVEEVLQLLGQGRQRGMSLVQVGERMEERDMPNDTLD